MSAAAGELAYDRSGQGEPLVLLHGLGGTRHTWDLVLPHLREVDVLVADLPGFGASPPLPTAGPHTPARLADAVERLLDCLDLAAPRIAGHSLGGWVALELAKRGRARDVTAICPAGLWPGDEPWDVRTALSVNRFLALTCRDLAPRLLGSALGRRVLLAGSSARPVEVSAAVAIRAAADLAAAPGYRAVHRGALRGRFTGGGDIAVPVQILLADSDRLLRPARNRCADQLPGQTTWHVLRSCGHVALWDSPAEVARALLVPVA